MMLGEESEPARIWEEVGRSIATRHPTDHHDGMYLLRLFPFTFFALSTRANLLRSLTTRVRIGKPQAMTSKSA